MRDAPPSTDTPALSVLMPLHGAPALLEASIATVLAQSCARWELLLIDDGANPAGQAVARDAAMADQRIRILQQDAPDHTITRNLGAMLARAPLLAFLEAGDLWATNRLASHLALHRTRPELVASFARMAFIAPGASVLVGARRCSALPSGPLTLPDVLGQAPPCMAGNLVVVRRHVLVGGGFDETLAHAQDQDLLARLVRDGGQFGAIDAVLTGHRPRPDLPAHPARMQDSWHRVIARHMQGTQARRIEALHCRDIARRVLGSGGRVGAALPHALRALRLDAGAFLGGWWRGMVTVLACLTAPIMPRGLRRRLFT